MNKTIYKDIKIKDNKLLFKGEELFLFKTDTALQEMIMHDSVGKMISQAKKDNALKKYIKEAQTFNVEKYGMIIDINLECKEDVGYRYHHTVSFIADEESNRCSFF